MDPCACLSGAKELGEEIVMGTSLCVNTTKYENLHAWPGQDNSLFQEPACSGRQGQWVLIYVRMNIDYAQTVSKGGLQ